MRQPRKKKLLCKHVLCAKGYIDDYTSNLCKKSWKILLLLRNIHLVEEETVGKQNLLQKNRKKN